MVWKENISIRRLILLRLPTDLKDRIQELAEFNNRSANQEVVAAIEYWILRNSHVEVLTISDAAERIFQLEREMEVKWSTKIGHSFRVFPI
ncbi:Arc family DNA-binding protein [Providencia rustigianii]|uniref:Arc family DNA-binding protein n=1 Tax=Providencia rustigianii TaxID=158850 RepID=UPI002AD58921|nr:Arc family DNA-binding protein [Providencia rustigianii]